MKVSFHLGTYEDIFNFMMVCKKAEDVIKSLKVNPFFKNTPSLQKFIKHFKVETIECHTTGYFSPNLYENVTYIRSPLWDDLKEEDKEIAIKLLSKISVLELFDSLIFDDNHNIVNDFFVKEAIHFTNLKKIAGPIELMVKFFKNYTEKGEMMYVNFPNRIEINSTSGFLITLNKTFLDEMKILLSYIPNNGLTTIVVLVYNNPPEENKDLLIELLQLQRVKYYYKVVVPNQTTSYENCLYCENGKLLVDGYVNGDRFNEIIEKSYTTTCVIQSLRDSKEVPIWNVPKCVSVVEIHGNLFYRALSRDRFKIFNADIGMIEELILKEVNLVNFQFPLISLVKLKVEKSSNCKFILNSPKLEHISLKDVENCLFVNSIDSVKEIVISKVTNCVLPFVSFENRSIHIEDSNDLYFGEKQINVFNDAENNEDDEVTKTTKEDQKIVENIRSPLEFMGIELNDFNELITDCLIYPSEVDLKMLSTKSTIFKMRTFQPQTTRVKVDGNTIKRVIPQGEDGVDLVVSSKFYVINDNLMINGFNTSESLIAATIRYFEVEVQNYCTISIGIIDSRRYEFEEDSQVGWDKGSIGYHSDDGCLFNEHGTNPISYGKAYGEKNGEKNIVGCGYNIITKELFFTVNGIKLQPIKIGYENISAAIGLSEFDPIRINYGDSPFVFDYYGEIEKYKELNSKLDNSE
ncbi:B30.2/SPRY domain-containing protein [Entamoeba marina]